MPIDKKKFADFYPSVGQTEQGGTIVLFTPAKDCTPDCPMYNEICPFKKGGKCKLEVGYLSNRAKMFMEIEDELTELELIELDEIMSGYLGLIRMLAELRANPFVLYTDDKGVKRINPVYQEVRKQISFIRESLTKSGLRGKLEAKYDPKLVGKKKKRKAKQDGYYEQMMRELNPGKEG